MLRNPYYVYCLTFGAALGIYQLGWAEILPPLSTDTWLFFAATIAMAALLGRGENATINSFAEYEPGLLPKYAGAFVVVTIAAEVWLNGIPLARVLNGEKFYEIEAAAHHLHVFSLWSVYSTIRFADFLYSKRKIYLFEAAMPLLTYGLFIYRGPAIILALSWAFVFIIKNRGLKVLHFSIAAAAAAAFLFINGVIGEMRSPHQAETLGLPSASFNSTRLPSSYFWTYLYITAPIGNLQLSVDKIATNQGSLSEFIATEFLPDTFSRRILPLINPEIQTNKGPLVSRDMLYSWTQPQVRYGINISTLFGRSYGYFGWIGPAIMFAALSCLIAFYIRLSQISRYRIVCLAMLNTMVVFCLFNNVLASAVMAPLLVWPLLFPPWR